jgi:transcriptional regulator with XRE-family HTH domain
MSTITGFQIRAARHGLKISAEQLSELSGVSARTIKRMETENDVPKSTVPNLNAIKAALQAAGIEFIGTPGDGPGIRIRTSPPKP